MRFQVGDIVRIGKTSGGGLDTFDLYWRDEGINGVVTDIEGIEYPVEVEFDEDSVAEDGVSFSGNRFEERTLKLVRRNR